MRQSLYQWYNDIREAVTVVTFLWARQAPRKDTREIIYSYMFKRREGIHVSLSNAVIYVTSRSHRHPPCVVVGTFFAFVSLRISLILLREKWRGGESDEKCRKRVEYSCPAAKDNLLVNVRGNTAARERRGSDFNHGETRGFGSIYTLGPVALWNTGIAKCPRRLITTNSGARAKQMRLDRCRRVRQDDLMTSTCRAVPKGDAHYEYEWVSC